jgi:uncharacterized membrane protein YtjA (UPF0391 family)
MLTWSLVFAACTVIAAVFGFTGIASRSAGFARALFFVCFVAFVVLLLLGLFTQTP